jgi:hypothetical protein
MAKPIAEMNLDEAKAAVSSRAPAASDSRDSPLVRGRWTQVALVVWREGDARMHRKPPPAAVVSLTLGPRPRR